MTAALALGGCRLQPLGSYLKALGVLRLVAAQVDPTARGAWHGDRFHLYSSLDADALVEFFADRYAPTPLVSPWNGGSGFGPKDQQAGIAAIEASDDARFAEYRAAIATGRRLVADSAWDDGAKDVKHRQILRCRAQLPDSAVAWLDAAVVLTADRAVFPPLFGTGGNDGRLDFSNNFMQRLAEILLTPRKRNAPDPTSWLRGALFGDDTGPLLDASAGQYEPNSAESDAVAASGRDTRLTNPWDFILVLEGGLVFASGAARRLGAETGSNKAAMPFCVDPSPVGYASAADGEESRGEVWAPVWRRPATAAEIQRLVGAGRADWDGRQAADGTDFAKAVATLGVDRGIDRFVRHGLVQRFGLSFLAVDLGEVVVGQRPDVDVLRQVDRWLRGVRGLPAAASSARRRVQAAEYRAATYVGRTAAAPLQDVLVALADLEAIIGRSARRAELSARPVSGLSAADWLPQLDDGSSELRLAVALASGRDRFPSGSLDQHARRASSLALLLRPIELDEKGRPVWGPSGERVDGLGRQLIERVVAAALARRSLDVLGRARPEGDEDVPVGPRLAFDTGFAATVDDVTAVLEGRLDAARLERLVRGLLLLDWRRARGDGEPAAGPTRPPGFFKRTTPALALLAPFFQAAPVRTPGGEGVPEEVELRPGERWAHLLATGDDGHRALVLDDALRRLRIAGLDPAIEKVRPQRTETGPWLALAALCRLTPNDASRLLAISCPAELTPDPEPDTTAEEALR